MAIVTVDFDGTLFQGNSFKVMFLAAKKNFKLKDWGIVFGGLVKATIFRITKGKEAFRHQFFKSFATSFRGKTKEELDRFFQNIIQLSKREIHTDLIKTIKEHQKNGDKVIILSGALYPFLEAFLQEVNLHVHVISTELKFNEAGICTGEIGTIVNGEEKVKRVKQWIKDNNFNDNEEIWAYADSNTDIPLFQFAKYPIVVNPDEEMKKIAEENDWPIFASS